MKFASPKTNKEKMTRWSFKNLWKHYKPGELMFMNWNCFRVKRVYWYSLEIGWAYEVELVLYEGICEGNYTVNWEGFKL
jgi:hypothetical protein